MAQLATAAANDDVPPARLAPTLALRRREEVARTIECAALALFAARPIGEVTVDEIATAAGIGVRTLYRYFPAKEDVFRAYPRRVAQQVADLLRARPSSETPFQAMRRAFCEFQPEPAERDRWMAAYSRSETHEQIARNARETMASGFSDALADRAGATRDDAWVEMAGWMAATAMDIGARQTRVNGGTLLDHVLAAWDVAGSGIAHVRSSNRRG
jgi:TetR/AcrR family transcriptional regulator, regulator of mycofactocin system